MVTPEEIREIFLSQLGQMPGDDAIQHYMETGLNGNELLRSIRWRAGLDNTLYDDAAYSAFDRGNSAARSRLMMNQEQRLGEIGQQRQMAARIFQRSQKDALANVDKGFESRGMLRAGERISRRADVAANMALQNQQQELGFTNQESSITRDTSDKLADLSQRRDEQEIAARDRLTDASIQRSANDRDL